MFTVQSSNEEEGRHECHNREPYVSLCDIYETPQMPLHCLSDLGSLRKDIVDQPCNFIVKLPLKYYLGKFPHRRRIVRRTCRRRGKQSKPLNIRIPLEKLNDIHQQTRDQQQAVSPSVSSPTGLHCRKKIEVTSCTTVIPLKQPGRTPSVDSENCKGTSENSECSFLHALSSNTRSSYYWYTAAGGIG